MGTLILIRHGESMWNAHKCLTGWVDVPLSATGIAQAQALSQDLLCQPLDVVFTSCLWRALQTVSIVLAAEKRSVPPVVLPYGDTFVPNVFYEQDHLPIVRDIRLNERYYGSIQGFTDAQLAQQYGKQKLSLWRKTYKGKPPQGESLEDTLDRVLPFIEDSLLPLLRKGKRILLCAHGTCLRAIIMHIEGLTSQAVEQLYVPTALLMSYQYENECFVGLP